MEDVKYQLFSTPILRVLCFLLDSSDIEYSDTEITTKVEGVKRAAIHQALTRLSRMGVVKRTHRGRRCYNILNFENVWLTYLKIATNVMTITPLIDQLKEHASSITLFGSRADGSNRHDSDFDLMVVSNNPRETYRIAGDSEQGDRLQLIVKTPEEMLSLESNEPVLTKRIRKGILLWEK